MTRAAQRPVDVSQWSDVLELVKRGARDGLVQLGRGMPDVTSPTLRPLLRSLAQVARRPDLGGLYYDAIQGSLPLREQISRLLVDAGCQIPASDLIITTGCHEALSASIRAICQPGT